MGKLNLFCEFECPLVGTFTSPARWELFSYFQKNGLSLSPDEILRRYKEVDNPGELKNFGGKEPLLEVMVEGYIVGYIFEV